jgi:hypothetical protein
VVPGPTGAAHFRVLLTPPSASFTV